MKWRSYAEWWRSRSRDELVDLVRLRPDLIHPAPEDLADLAARAATPSSVARALRQLNAWQMAVLEALVATGTLERAAMVLATDQEPAELAAADLVHRGLVWGDEQVVREARIALGPTPGGLAPDSVQPLDEAQIDQAVAGLSEPARALVDRLVWGPPTGRITGAASRGPRTPVGSLTASGLLRIVDADTVEIPREVAWRLREPRRLHREAVSPTPPSVISEQTEPPGLTGLRARLSVQTAVATATELVHDVEACVEWIATQETVPLVRDGGLAARTVAALRSATGLGVERVSLCVELAAAAGLLLTGSLQLNVTTAHDLWLASSTLERWQVLVQAWQSMSRWPAHGIAAGEHILGEGAQLGPARDLRRAAVAALTEAGSNRQLDLDRCVELLAWQRPARARMPWPLPDLVSDLWAELHALGLLRDAGVTTVLLPAAQGEPLPAEVTGQFAEPVAEVILQADLTAVAAGQLTADVARTLRLLGDQESRGAGAVFRFTAASVRRGFDAGWSADEIRTWLIEHSVTPLPQPLDYLIADTARVHGSVRVGTAWCYVRTDDEAQAAAVVSQPEARALGLRQIAPGVLVAESEPEQVVALLRRLGLHPAAEDTQGRTVTAPAPLRVAPPPPSSGRDPAEVDEIVEAVLERDRHRAAAARAVTDAFTAVRTAHSDGSWLRLTYVGDDGTSHDTVARPITLGSGIVRISGPDGTRTLPLARVVSALPADPPR